MMTRRWDASTPDSARACPVQPQAGRRERRPTRHAHRPACPDRPPPCLAPGGLRHPGGLQHPGGLRHPGGGWRCARRPQWQRRWPQAPWPWWPSGCPAHVTVATRPHRVRGEARQQRAERGRPGEIAQMTVTTRGAAISGGKTATTTAEEWSYGDQWRAVTYSPAGHPVYDEGFGTSSVYTLVSYPARTWARQHGLGRPARAAVSGPCPAPPGCELTRPVPSPLLFRVRAAGHRLALQFAACDCGQRPAHRGLLRNPGRGWPAARATGSRPSS